MSEPIIHAEVKVTPSLAEHLEAIVQRINGVAAPHQAELLQLVAGVAVLLMRGSFGEDFTCGFLTGALDSLDQPAEVLVRLPVKH